jgi:hypothetical protein
LWKARAGHRSCCSRFFRRHFGEVRLQTVATVGLDIAKSVFQVHCVDSTARVVIRRQLKRCYVLAFFQKLPRCLIGIVGRKQLSLPTMIDDQIETSDVEMLCQGMT